MTTPIGPRLLALFSVTCLVFVIFFTVAKIHDAVALRNECIVDLDCQGNSSTCVNGACHCDVRFLHGHKPYQCVPGLEFPAGVFTALYIAVLVFCCLQVAYMGYLEGKVIHGE